MNNVNTMKGTNDREKLLVIEDVIPLLPQNIGNNTNDRLHQIERERKTW